MKKAIIFGYHEIGCILLDELEKNNIKISLILGDYRKHENQTNSWYRDIRKLALNKKIKIIETKNLKKKKIVNLIKKIKPNIIFSAYTNLILTTEILSIPDLGCYNFHNSDLPKDRGRAAPIHTLAKGKRRTALTMHHISKEIDQGDIVDKEYIYLEKKDDIKRLYLKHNFALKKILDRQIPYLKKKKLTRFPQKKIKEKNNMWIEGESDLMSFKQMSVTEINDKVRSLKYPFKVTTCFIDNKKISIHDVEIYRKKDVKGFKPGQIVKIEKYDLIVKAKDGFMRIKEISYFGRHILPSHFILENKIKKFKVFS